MGRRSPVNPIACVGTILQSVTPDRSSAVWMTDITWRMKRKESLETRAVGRRFHRSADRMSGEGNRSVNRLVRDGSISDRQSCLPLAPSLRPHHRAQGRNGTDEGEHDETGKQEKSTLEVMHGKRHHVHHLLLPLSVPRHGVCHPHRQVHASAGSLLESL